MFALAATILIYHVGLNQGWFLPFMTGNMVPSSVSSPLSVTTLSFPVSLMKRRAAVLSFREDFAPGAGILLSRGFL